MSDKMIPAAEIMRDYILNKAIPELESLGKAELVERLREAVEIGDEKAKEHASYWEGIRIFAQNGLQLAAMEGQVKEIQNAVESVSKQS